MPLPLNNPHHFLFGISFQEQCQAVIDITDYCALFGVTHNFTIEEIKSAYKQLSRFFHPDKNADCAELATRAMHKIHEAKSFFDAELEKAARTQNQTHNTGVSQYSYLDDFINLMKNWARRYPPQPNSRLPLSETSNLDLLSRLYWQHENDVSDDSDSDSDYESGSGNSNATPESIQNSLQNIVTEIKSRISRITTYQNDSPIYNETLVPSHYTLLRIVVKLDMTEFFEWLLENIPENDLPAILNQRYEESKNFIYDILSNPDSSVTHSMLTLLNSKFSPEQLGSEFTTILRSTYVNKDTLACIANLLPNNYLFEHAEEIAQENPYFLPHIALYLDTEKSKQVIHQSLQTNPQNYNHLCNNDRRNLEYIISAFRTPEGRTPQNIVALPIYELPTSFIIAMTKSWPDLEKSFLHHTKKTVDLPVDGYIYFNTAYGKMKDSGKLDRGSHKRIAKYLIIDSIMIVAYTTMILVAPKAVVHMPILVLATAILLLSALLIKLAYETYQWNNVRSYRNKITFFQNSATGNKSDEPDVSADRIPKRLMPQ